MSEHREEPPPPGDDDAPWAAPPPRARPRVVDASAPAPSRLGLRPVAELLAEVIPPIEWVIPDYVERGALAAIVSAPNTGKTLLAVHWIVAAALRGERVALVEEEGGRRGLQKRLSRAIAAAGGLEAIHAAGGEILLAIKPRLSLMNHSDIAALCAELKGCTLVVLDSLARMTAGLEENDSSEMSRIVEALESIRTLAGLAVLVIHHSGKSAWKLGQAPSIGDGRGSSALAGGLDAIIHLTPVPPSERQEGYVTAIVHATKQRDAECARPMRFSVLMQGPAAHVELSEVEGPTLEQREGVEGDVLRYLQRSGGVHTRTEITAAVEGRAVRVRAAIDALLQSGAIENVQVGRHAKLRARGTPEGMPSHAVPSRPDSTEPTEPSRPTPKGVGGGTGRVDAVRGDADGTDGRVERSWYESEDDT